MEARSDTLPPYPEGSPGFESKQGTYWHKLSANNIAALQQVQKWVDSNNVDLNELAPYALDHRLTILRYLRANNFDTKKAANHMKENIEWRRLHKVSEIGRMSPEELLGFPMSTLTKVFPHWHFGYDKTGRPVVYKQYGKFNATEIKALAGGNYDNILKYHIWEQEVAAKLCREQSLMRGEIVETVTGIVDVKEMRMLQITGDFLNLTKLLAEIDQKQYPETMGRIYILNVPTVFPIVWRIVRPWLDPITAAKIFVLGDRREYEPKLIDFIGKENLPSNYGGDLVPLSVSIHPYAETMREFEIQATTIVSAVRQQSSCHILVAEAVVEEDTIDTTSQQLEALKVQEGK
jgi:hypothetical protein